VPTVTIGASVWREEMLELPLATAAWAPPEIITWVA
jgi:hypothetical protein